MFQELLDNLTNVGVFTSSVQEWVSTLSINKVIIFIMMKPTSENGSHRVR